MWLHFEIRWMWNAEKVWLFKPQKKSVRESNPWLRVSSSRSRSHCAFCFESYLSLSFLPSQFRVWLPTVEYRSSLSSVTLLSFVHSSFPPILTIPNQLLDGPGFFGLALATIQSKRLTISELLKESSPLTVVDKAFPYCLKPFTKALCRDLRRTVPIKKKIKETSASTGCNFTKLLKQAFCTSN